MNDKKRPFTPEVLIWESKQGKCYFDSTTIENKRKAIRSLFHCFDNSYYFCDLKNSDELKRAKIKAEKESSFCKRLFDDGEFEYFDEDDLNQLKEKYEHKGYQKQYKSIRERKSIYDKVVADIKEGKDPVMNMLNLLYLHGHGEYETWWFDSFMSFCEEDILNDEVFE